MKIKLIMEDEGIKVKHTFEFDTMSEALDHYRWFLAGCGFCVDPMHVLEFVPCEESHNDVIDLGEL